MDAALEKLVRTRAKDACEYCGFDQRFSRLTFPIDHIIALQHQGSTLESNLALVCPFCNSHKGPNIAGIDPVSRQLSRLFNPRTDSWSEHFRFDGVTAIGLTEIGRTTIAVLAINDPAQLAVRHSLLVE